jgi:hypothetical protein
VGGGHRWWRLTKPKPTCLYSSPTSAYAGASGTAAARQAERLVRGGCGGSS